MIDTVLSIRNVTYQQISHDIYVDGIAGAFSADIREVELEENHQTSLSWLNQILTYRSWTSLISQENGVDVALGRNYTSIPIVEGCDDNVISIAYISSPSTLNLDYYDPRESHISNFQRWHSIQYPLILWVHRTLIRTLKSADLAVTNSKYMRELIDETTGVRPNIVYPPIQTDQYQISDGEYIGMVSPRKKQKGADILSDIASRMPDEEFLVCGAIADEYKSEILEQPNISYIGWQKHMPDFYQQCKAVIMPSTEEAFGRVAAESLASGLPTIVSNIGGLPEVVGDVGTVVERYRDPDAWKDAIEVALDEHSSERAREQVKQFDVQRQIDRFVEMIEEQL